MNVFKSTRSIVLLIQIYILSLRYYSVIWPALKWEEKTEINQWDINVTGIK